MRTCSVLDTHFSHRKLQSLEQELSECTGEIARVSEAEQTTRDQINDGEARLAAARRGLDAADGKITGARAKVQQLENEIASLRHRIEFNENMPWSCGNGSIAAAARSNRRK